MSSLLAYLPPALTGFVLFYYTFQIFSLWPFWDEPPSVKKRAAALYLLMWGGLWGGFGLSLSASIGGMIWGIFPIFILLPLTIAASFQWDARFRPHMDAREASLFKKRLKKLPFTAPDCSLINENSFLWKETLYTFGGVDRIEGKHFQKIYRRGRAWFSFNFSYPDGTGAEGLALFYIRGRHLYFLDFAPCLKKHRPFLSPREDPSPENHRAWKKYLGRLYAVNGEKHLDTIGWVFSVHSDASGWPPLYFFPRRVKVF